MSAAEAVAAAPNAKSSPVTPETIPEAPPALHQFVPKTDPILERIHAQNTCWTKIKAAFTDKTQTERDLEVFHTLSPEKKIPTLIAALEMEGHPRIHLLLRPIIKQMAAEQINDFHKLLQEVTKKILDENASPHLLQNCLGMLTLQELQGVLKEVLKNEAPLDLQLHDMAKVERTLTQNLQFMAGRVKAVQDSSVLPKVVCELIETILNAFSFFQIGKDPGSSWEASHLLSVYGRIIAFPLLLITALNVVMSAAAAFIATVAIILLVAGLLTAYIKWLRPCPTNIFPCKNLSEKALAGTLDPVFGRNCLIGRVLEDVKSNIAVILVGETGSGKSSIANGIALKTLGTGITVLSVNCEDLLENGSFSGGSSKLSRLIEHIKPFNDQIFLFLDEFQAVIGTPLQYQLRTELTELRHVFAAITNDGYDRLCKLDKELKRRFTHREVPGTNERQTLLILRDHFHRKAPDLDITETVMQEIWKRTANEVQPDAAKQLLESAIAYTRFTFQFTDSEISLNDREEAFANLSSRYKHSFHTATKEVQSLGTHLKAYEEDIAKLAPRVNAKREKSNDLKKWRALRVKQCDAIFALALKMSQEKDAAVVDDLKKQILFSVYYIIDMIEKLTNQHSKDAPLPNITMEIINKLKPQSVSPPASPPDGSAIPAVLQPFAILASGVSSQRRSQSTPPQSTSKTAFRPFASSLTSGLNVSDPLPE